MRKLVEMKAKDDGLFILLGKLKTNIVLIPQFS